MKLSINHSNEHIYSLYIHLFIIYFYLLLSTFIHFFKNLLDILLPSAGMSDKYIESLLNLNHTRKKDSSIEPATETVLKRFPAIADHVCYPALDCFIGTLFSSILYSFQFCKKQTFRLLPLFNQTLMGGYRNFWLRKPQYVVIFFQLVSQLVKSVQQIKGRTQKDPKEP